MGEGVSRSKIKSPEIAPIVSGARLGVAHEVQRAPHGIGNRSYVLGGFLPAQTEEHTDTNINAASETCADVSSTSVALL